MCINPKSRFIMSKAETTPYSAETPTPATDGLYVSDESGGIVVNMTQVQNNPATPTGFRFKSINGTAKPTASYRVPCYMKGLSSNDIVVPRYAAKWLASCGLMDFSVGSGAPTDANAFDWSPDGIYPRSLDKDGVTVTAALQTHTIYDYMGRSGSEAAGSKLLHRMIGATVSSVALNVTIGDWVFLDFEFLGLYVEPAVETDDLSAYSVDGASDFLVPFGAEQRMTFADASTDDFNPSTTVWTIDFGAAHTEGDAAGSRGVVCVTRQQAVVTMTTNPLSSISTYDKWAGAQDEALTMGYTMEGSLTPQGRTADTGYTLRVTAPQVQGTWSDERGENLRLNFTGEATTPDGTTPPITFSFS